MCQCSNYGTDKCKCGSAKPCHVDSARRRAVAEVEVPHTPSGLTSVNPQSYVKQPKKQKGE